MEVERRILDHYEHGYPEADRLTKDAKGRLVALRTWDVFERFLPPTGRVLDVGGGPGVHAEWFVGRGYDVALLDPVELHVRQARARSDDYEVHLGDARALPFDDGSADAVVLLGPIYHLVERADRDDALSEAVRVLRPGGRLLVETITRHAWVIDATMKGLLGQAGIFEQFAHNIDVGLTQIPDADLEVGMDFWAYLHRPDEIALEVTAAGFEVDTIVGVEGYGWLLGDLDEHLDDDPAPLLQALRLVEAEPSMLGVSAHLITVATRP